MKSITWLHLSDLHYCKAKTGWDAGEVLEKLTDDLKAMENRFDLKPDLIFFTGDLAYGHEPSKGWNIKDQYRGVYEFLEKVRTAFTQEIPRENIFIVPGNHDVNRKAVTKMMTHWIERVDDENEITEMIKSGEQEWKDYMKRLQEYLKFLNGCGYNHLLTDPERLIYSIKRQVNGFTVGIGGFNSAWSCGRDKEKGNLWIGAKWQLADFKAKLKDADFTIALNHHPTNWFNEKEDRPFAIKLQESFRFFLHGHEHSEWVTELANGHTTISADACYESSDGNNGYNFVRLDFDKSEAEVFLRQYSPKGAGGWIACNVPGKTDDHGRWGLKNTSWMKSLSRSGDKPDPVAPEPAKALETHPVAAPEYLRSAYLNRLVQTTRKLYLSGIDTRAISCESDECLNLEAVYTSLLTHSVEDEARLSDSHEKAARLSALTLLDRHSRLVLLGYPGSGKSTFVNFAALCLAGERLNNLTANLNRLTSPLPDDKGKDGDKPQPWSHGALIPVLIVLRDFAARGLKSDDKALLWRFIESELRSAVLGGFAPHLYKELMEQGGLILLDGLDEVSEAHKCREQIKAAVEEFAATFHKCRIVVTSRTYAYQKQSWRLSGFEEAELAPFSAGQIRRFVDQWYSHMAAVRGQNRDDAQGRAELLKHVIFASSRLLELAERPLLLTLMASLHAWRGGSLPEKREELYADAVDLLLYIWEKQKTVRDAMGKEIVHPSLAEWLKTDRDKMRRLLNALAYKVHSSQPELVGTADIAGSDLVNGLFKISSEEKVNPVQLVEHLSYRAGLIVPRGEDVYTFPHRTFQEYLAACHLTDADYPDLIAKLSRTEPNRWREVALLAGAKAARGSAGNIWSLADALCYRELGDKASLKDVWGAHLAAQALLESADLSHVSERNQQKLALIIKWLVRVLGEERMPPAERALAGRSLAQLGDPRADVMTVDAMEFCLVPAGPFWMGEDKLHLNKSLKYDYWASRYPVTNAQYMEFVEAGGYKEAGYWKEAIKAGFWKEKKLLDRKSSYNYGVPFTLTNHPVVGVTWYEALAFTRWLTEKWYSKGILPTEWSIVLPSEAQWEKAARGGVDVVEQPIKVKPHKPGDKVKALLKPNPLPKRKYPWGDKPSEDLANCKESGINSTSAVGCFPCGVSPYGCEEMAGNVLEWTISLYDKSNDVGENLKVDLSTWQTLRGSAYWSESPAVGCGVRDWNYQDEMGDDGGFRIALSPSTLDSDPLLPLIL